jgi:Cu/Ag efflux protein CusF
MAGVVLVCAAAVPQVRAQQPSGNAVVVAAKAPGKGAVGASVQKVATVTSIDKASRNVTLQMPDGRVARMVAGPEVRNFDGIAVGDRVLATYTEAVALELTKQGDGIRERSESAQAVRAPEGGKPGAAIQSKVVVIADVVGADPRTRMVTLRGPERTVDLHVPDAKQFGNVKVGDQVRAVFTETLVVDLRPAPKR